MLTRGTLKSAAALLATIFCLAVGLALETGIRTTNGYSPFDNPGTAGTAGALIATGLIILFLAAGPLSDARNACPPERLNGWRWIMLMCLVVCKMLVIAGFVLLFPSAMLVIGRILAIGGFIATIWQGMIEEDKLIPEQKDLVSLQRGYALFVLFAGIDALLIHWLFV